jgi:hypothetical protein
VANPQLRRRFGNGGRGRKPAARGDVGSGDGLRARSGGPLVQRHSVEGLQTKLKFFALSQREEFWLNRAIRYSLRQEEV